MFEVETKTRREELEFARVKQLFFIRPRVDSDIHPDVRPRHASLYVENLDVEKVSAQNGGLVQSTCAQQMWLAGTAEQTKDKEEGEPDKAGEHVKHLSVGA
ncbi:MAG TPA: hypothetical protein PKV55_06355 [Nitrospira sp.]|nr:hypothetical protein [Nitrospira sp.]